MKLGIIGLPAAGKTTVFNALTGAHVPVGALSPSQDVHTAVVDVPDPRIDELSHLFHPRKTTYAKVTYEDFGGMAADPSNGGIPGPVLNQMQQLDGLIQVVRAFDAPSVPHHKGSVNAIRDLRELNDELILNDMLAVERRLDKLAREHKRGLRDKGSVAREAAIFERLQAALAHERPLRDLDLTVEETKTLSGFGLLTLKPTLVVVNLGEGQEPPELGELGPGVEVLPLQGRLEMDIAQMSPDEMRLYLKEYGIDQPGRARVLQASYALLGLASFFTVGEDEVRAWTVPANATALEAAGAIHSDLARGFIRAEVIGWNDLLSIGGWSQSREAGRLRVQGKDYSVQDGDILHVRFNV
jgi:GTP-binding protein YchF